MRHFPLFFKVVILLVFGVLISALSFRIIDEAKYNPATGKYLSGCTPDDAGIYETEIYHHVLVGCSNYYDVQYINQNNTVRKLDYRTRVSINTLGFRNREYSLKKSPGTTRIILLGDSFTYGFGVEKGDAFFTRLEEKLNSGCKGNFEVWNIAATSWGTPIHYLITKNKVLNYSPDLVILMFDLSDFSDTLFYEDQGTFIDGELMNVSPVDQDWYGTRNRLQAEFLGNATDGSGRERNFELASRTYRYIEKMNSLLESSNISFEVITYPYPATADDSQNILYQDLYGLMDKSDIRHFSMFPYLKPEYRPRYYNQNHLHWNNEGSEYVAGIIYDHLRTRFNATCG
jgi:hypothetical protein